MKIARYLLIPLVAAIAVVAAVVERDAPRVQARSKTETDPQALERTREQIKMLDDLYKTAVVSITGYYVEKQADVPAAAVAKDVFAAMHKKGWHNARLVDATGKPKNKDNVPQTDFEKKAVAEIKEGKTYYEEVGTADGKPVLRAGTIVPAVMKQCTICHGGKEALARRHRV